MTRRAYDIGVCAVALAAAYALKRHYSAAHAAELDWVLRPTALLVSLLTSSAFDRSPGDGYVSGALATVIAPACAGVNYLIIAFCTLVFGFVTSLRSSTAKLVWLALSALGAFAATVLVNAARITLGIIAREHGGPSWVSPEQVHRVLGVIVYLGSLWLLFALAERVAPRLRSSAP